jgi:Heparinase II/III-like protein
MNSKIENILFFLLLILTLNSNAATRYVYTSKIDSALAPNQYLVGLLKQKSDFSKKYQYQNQWKELAGELFQHPTAASIIEAVKRKHPNQSHPRILANASDFESLRLKIKNNPTYAGWYKSVEQDADKILNMPVVNKPERHTLLSRMLSLGMVYKISGDKKYAQRAWLEMEAYSKLEHWNPTTQFLDIGYISKGMAVGFDWLYDYLSAEQKELITKTICEKVLKLIMVAYQNPGTFEPYQNSKITGFDNWNASCNTGAIMAALAVCDEKLVGQLGGEVVKNGVYYWQNYLKEFAPDGACKEGVGYWYWGVQSMVEGLATLESAIGTDCGLSRSPGFAYTPYFSIYLTGPTGNFDFGNAHRSFQNISAEFFWFGSKYDDSKIANYRKTFMDLGYIRGGVYDLLWYNESQIGKKTTQLPNNMMFRETEVVSLRSDWSENALFVALKGGYNMATHGHMNTGTFVLDALGERWVTQLGADNYSNPGYWRREVREGQAYQYYRVRAEGQNTLLINPDQLSEQIPTSISKIVKFSSESNQSFGIIDMTEAYRHVAKSVKRGVMMNDGRQVILRDEIICNSLSEVWWFAHTRATIEIKADGKSAILSQNGKRMMVGLQCSDAKATFSIMDAIPLPSSPQSPLNAKNIGVKKLAIHLHNAIDANITVIFKAEEGDLKNNKTKNSIDLKDWN